MKSLNRSLFQKFNLFVWTLISSATVSSSSFAVVWDQKILLVKENRSISLNELALNLVFARNVVLGEKHNTAAIQQAQAKVIEAVVALAPHDRFTTAWEFLNYKDQIKIDEAFQKFVAGTITVDDLLTITQGNAKYKSYGPILEVTKKFGGTLMGVNLSRLDKDPVTQGGLSNAKPGTVPAQFEMGGSNYWERFRKSMEGHATESQMQNYFASQCLTDDVIAEQMLISTGVDRRFLVVGSFHADYFDGTVARLVKRAPTESLGLVRFIDASDYSESELQALAVDAKYGPIADLIYFVNEPLN